MVDDVPGFLITLVGHRTGIDHRHVGVIRKIDYPVTGPVELCDKCVGLILVQPAAQCLERNPVHMCKVNDSHLKVYSGKYALPMYPGSLQDIRCIPDHAASPAKEELLSGVRTGFRKIVGQSSLKIHPAIPGSAYEKLLSPLLFERVTYKIINCAEQMAGLYSIELSDNSKYFLYWSSKNLFNMPLNREPEVVSELQSGDAKAFDKSYTVRYFVSSYFPFRKTMKILRRSYRKNFLTSGTYQLKFKLKGTQSDQQKDVVLAMDRSIVDERHFITIGQARSGSKDRYDY